MGLVPWELKYMATFFLIYILILKISLNFKNNNFYENSLRQCIYLYNTSNVKPLRISIFLQDFITDLRHSENALTPKDWKQILYPRISLSLSIPYLILWHLSLFLTTANNVSWSYLVIITLIYIVQVVRESEELS